MASYIRYYYQVFGFGRQKDEDQMQNAVIDLETNFKEDTLATHKMFRNMHSAIELRNRRLGHMSA